MPDNIYIVVPAYNEEEVIQSTISGLLAFFSNIVVVNDGSTDNTRAIIERMDVTLINHLINIGQGAALQSGITYALDQGAEIIVSFDADGQHQVTDASAMIERIQQDGCVGAAGAASKSWMCC